MVLSLEYVVPSKRTTDHTRLMKDLPQLPVDVEMSTTKSSHRDSNEGTLKIITGVNGLSGADIVTRCASDDEHSGVEVGKQLDACSWVSALRDRASLMLRRLMLIPSTRTVDTVLQKQLLRLSPMN